MILPSSITDRLQFSVTLLEKTTTVNVMQIFDDNDDNDHDEDEDEDDGTNTNDTALIKAIYTSNSFYLKITLSSSKL